MHMYYQLRQSIYFEFYFNIVMYIPKLAIKNNQFT